MWVDRGPFVQAAKKVDHLTCVHRADELQKLFIRELDAAVQGM